MLDVDGNVPRFNAEEVGSLWVPIDAELLERFYITEGLTADQIASRISCGANTILRRLRRFGIPIRPRGPRLTAPRSPVTWSPELAWAVGVLATDGNLSSDGRHLAVPSKDPDLLESLRRCLNLQNRLALRVINDHQIYRLQWGNRQFYTWLLGIGLTPAKSLTLGPLAVPDEHLVHFLRGCIDGDGSITTYVDHYNTFKKPTYVYTRLFVSIVSASPRFPEWLRACVQKAGRTFRKPNVSRWHCFAGCTKTLTRLAFAGNVISLTRF